jgi:hypothetical protein
MKSAARPLALFISYSHKDDDLRAKLDTHLSLLKRQNVFDVWHDRRIGAGREWAGEIDSALERADVVLLLVSADFLASDYCYDKEMMRALQRHDQGTARVVPVILRRCDWQSSAFGRLQALPRDGQPVTGYADVDTAFTEVAVALRALANEIRGPGHTPAATSASAASPAAPSQPPQETAAAPAGEEPPDHPVPAGGQRLKIGAIKLGFFEVGPFELGWPPQVGAGRLIGWIVAGLALLAGAATLTYWLALKPRLDETRDLMRRADYPSAARAVESVPPWSRALPFVVGLTAQARFGSKLAGGEHIRNLAPELQTLRKRYPSEPDVLVFEGLESYYVDSDPEKALAQFTQAAMRDEAHVEAHFLAAGRHVDLAYAALSEGSEARARSAAVEARKLIERAVGKSAFAETLPRYANQIAELYELEGNSPGAYSGYAKLAPLHSLSALQAALVSWRLPEADTALQRSLEAAEAAVTRIENEPKDISESEGWSFRISATELVDVRPKAEKICLLSWAVEISKSLQSISGSGLPAENTAGGAPGLAALPERCGKGAVAARTREIVCVHVLTAQREMLPSDARQKVLGNWKATRLQCGRDQRPLPALPPDGAAAKPTAGPAKFGDEHDVENT